MAMNSIAQLMRMYKLFNDWQAHTRLTNTMLCLLGHDGVQEKHEAVIQDWHGNFVTSLDHNTFEDVIIGLEKHLSTPYEDIVWWTTQYKTKSGTETKRKVLVPTFYDDTYYTIFPDYARALTVWKRAQSISNKSREEDVYVIIEFRQGEYVVMNENDETIVFSDELKYVRKIYPTVAKVEVEA